MSEEQDSWLSYLGVNFARAEKVASAVAGAVAQKVAELEPPVVATGSIYSDSPLRGIAGPVSKPVEDYAAQDGVVEARPLTADELAESKVIFRDSLDYSAIKVDGGSVLAIGSTRTVGNTIHLEAHYFKTDSSETTTEGRRIVVHELTHVWQYQHSGMGYIPESLWAQVKAVVTKGTRNAAYDWQDLVIRGIKFEDWNPEQQAQCVEDYNRSLQSAKSGTASKEDYLVLTLAAPYIRQLFAGPDGSGSAPESVLNTASGMQVMMTGKEDGPWSCNWSWTYDGTEVVDFAEIHEVFLLLDDRGVEIDAVTAPGHKLIPRQTYSGTCVGARKMPPGKAGWKLEIPYQSGFIGVATGSLFNLGI